MPPEFFNGEKLRRIVIFLITKDGRVLLERRIKEGSSYYGQVIIPGGGIEEGESSITAMERELKEELGITREQMVDLGQFVDWLPGSEGRLVNAYLITRYDGEVVNKEPNNAEHLWLLPHEADEKLKLGSSKLVLDRARRFISKQAG